jgi:hypothetical protein
MCTQYVAHMCHPTPFLHMLLTPSAINNPDRIFSYPLFPDFVKEKSYIFVCLRSLYCEFACDISMCRSGSVHLGTPCSIVCMGADHESS